jgi:hypothetical protein
MSSTTLIATDGAERWTTIEEQARLVVADAEREVVQPADLALAHADADILARALATRRAGAAGPRICRPPLGRRRRSMAARARVPAPHTVMTRRSSTSADN